MENFDKNVTIRDTLARELFDNLDDIVNKVESLKRHTESVDQITSSLISDFDVDKAISLRKELTLLRLSLSRYLQILINLTKNVDTSEPLGLGAPEDRLDALVKSKTIKITPLSLGTILSGLDQLIDEAGKDKAERYNESPLVKVRKVIDEALSLASKLCGTLDSFVLKNEKGIGREKALRYTTEVISNPQIQD